MANAADVLDLSETSTKPVRVFRAPRGLSASVFLNRATVRDREVAFFKTQLQRTYKDGDEFKTTQSLGRDDLLTAANLLTDAWRWVVAEEAKLRAVKS